MGWWPLGTEASAVVTLTRLLWAPRESTRVSSMTLATPVRSLNSTTFFRSSTKKHTTRRRRRAGTNSRCTPPSPPASPKETSKMCAPTRGTNNCLRIKTIPNQRFSISSKKPSKRRKRHEFVFHNTYHLRGLYHYKIL